MCAADSSSSSGFELSQRSPSHKPATWTFWFFKQTGFMFIKFAFCVAFYALQFQSHRLFHASSPAAAGTSEPGLQEYLSQFRASSRTSRHHQELDKIRARQLAENISDEHRTQVYEWTPLKEKGAQCSAAENAIIDPFPDSFDAVFYQNAHSQDYNHYLEHGRANGWNCTRGQYLREIINTEIVPVLPGSVLEVGPFVNPLIRSTTPSKVRYFDLADWDTLVQTAELHGYQPSLRPVVIDYVDKTGNLASIINNKGSGSENDAPQNRPKFSMVVSANVIGFQRDFVRHLQQVSELLEEGGYYAMLVPDKRFSHDHFSAETTIADVLAEHHFDGKDTADSTSNTPTMKSLVQNRALQVANDAEKNWNGEYGFPYQDASDPDFLEKVQDAIYRFVRPERFNLDALQHHFMPDLLAFIVDTLYRLGLTNLRVHRLYDTLANTDEFGIVLKQCTTTVPTVESDKGEE